jgi:hypothetical protein
LGIDPPLLLSANKVDETNVNNESDDPINVIQLKKRKNFPTQENLTMVICKFA